MDETMRCGSLSDIGPGAYIIGLEKQTRTASRGHLERRYFVP
jgi:hypothetical protein